LISEGQDILRRVISSEMVYSEFLYFESILFLLPQRPACIQPSLLLRESEDLIPGAQCFSLLQRACSL